MSSKLPPMPPSIEEMALLADLLDIAAVKASIARATIDIWEDNGVCIGDLRQTISSAHRNLTDAAHLINQAIAQARR